MSHPDTALAWRPASLDGFVLQRVLSHDPSTKTLALLGTFTGHEGQAVLRLTRPHFITDPALLQGELLTNNTSLKLTLANDVYSKFDATVPPAHASVNVDLIHPATAKHIARAEEQPLHMVRETPALYAQLVLPFIQGIPASRLQWVYNILEKKAEVERLIFEDPNLADGFMMHPDMKWDQKNNEQLYCLVLCQRRDIPSLRSLTAEHLPLLKNIRAKAAQAVQDRFLVDPQDLRMYVHYPPSYYHFHVHVTHTKSFGQGSAVGKAHLLDDIIDNIETFGSDFYQRRSLSLVVSEGDDLWHQVYKAAAGGA